MVKKSTLESILQQEMSDFWALLENEEKRIIAENFKIQNFKKNEIIYSEGEDPAQLMCLLKGKVKIYKDGVGGRSQIIRLIRPVQYFGYRAYFSREPYVTAAAAIEKFADYLIGKDPFRIEDFNQNFLRSVYFRGSVIMSAISAIDIALWDIKGKALGVPVYELFGRVFFLPVRFDVLLRRILLY
jgi:signal-transduction protein with cAMP-binding, CBS, and nucleotidyltransferase domain